MNVRNSLEKQLEVISHRQYISESIAKIEKDYNISDTVLYLNVSNGQRSIRECMRGFWRQEGTYDSLTEAVQNMDYNVQGIRLTGGRYEVGTISEKYVPSDSLVIDLKTYSVV